MTRRRMAALLRKEWLDLSRNPGALAPVVIVAVLTVSLSLGIVFGIPGMTGEPFSNENELVRLSLAAGAPLPWTQTGPTSRPGFTRATNWACPAGWRRTTYLTIGALLGGVNTNRRHENQRHGQLALSRY